MIEDDVRIIGDVEIGANVSIAGPTELMAKFSRIEIGDGCDIAGNVLISTADSHDRCRGASDTVERLPICIGARVFIGAHAVILGGTNIGEGSVIGAGVVLKKTTIPPNSRVRLAPVIIEAGYYDTLERIDAAITDDDADFAKPEEPKP